jgi:plastocyanin
MWDETGIIAMSMTGCDGSKICSHDFHSLAKMMGGRMKRPSRPQSRWKTGALVFLLVSLLTTAGQESESARPQKSYKRTGQEGTITGTIHFSGKAPVRNPMDMSQDYECAKSNRRPLTENVIVTRGKLANVFIYVTGGALDEYAFETPSSPAVLDQKRCRFVPHVLGIQVGQELHVLNSDPTTHNVNVQSKSNPRWNISQTAAAPPIVKTFARAELLIPFKCNQHPWMKAWVNVLKHPFFAVSGRDGAYKIEGLPPGEYTLTAWHEKFGEQTMQVTIVPYEEARALDFTFKDSSEDQ